MAKYIDADRLNADLDKWVEAMADAEGDYSDGVRFAIQHFIFLLASLQQEQPELPGIEESGVPGKDYIPVEWVDACEKYGKWKIVKQEQPEVDLEKIIEQTYHDGSVVDTSDMDHVTYENIARHFYELRNRALEEAARHVYESWMGGKMDDVRRDMVELGRVINARKEE